MDRLDRQIRAARRKAVLSYAVGVLGGVALGVLGMWLATDLDDLTHLHAPVRAAILEHDREVLQDELATARAEVESAYAVLGLLCNPPPKSQHPPAAVADDDPAIPSFKDDCAITWFDVLDKKHGRRQILRYGRAVELRWCPWNPRKAGK